jgi:hypothetical protein
MKKLVYFIAIILQIIFYHLPVILSIKYGTSDPYWGNIIAKLLGTNALFIAPLNTILLIRAYKDIK